MVTTKKKSNKIPAGLSLRKKGWYIKANGKTHYVASKSAPESEVLAKYHTLKSKLLNTVVMPPPTPPVPSVVATAPKESSILVSEVKRQFMVYLNQQLAAGEMEGPSVGCHVRTLPNFVTFFEGRTVASLLPSDFAEYRASLNKKKYAVASLSRHIASVRRMFYWAEENYVIPSLPRWGSSFNKPSAKLMRIAKTKKIDKVGIMEFSAEQMNQILDECSTRMKCLVLLALNGGMGNGDLAHLPISRVDLANAVIDWPRKKTGVPRTVPLWDITVKAIKDWMLVRPKPEKAEYSNLLFLTVTGCPMVKQAVGDATKATKHWTRSDSIAVGFGQLLTRLKMKRTNLSFYSIRHTFATVAVQTKDFMSVSRIMGHEVKGISTMTASYVGKVEVAELRKVTDHVLAWLHAGQSQTAAMRPNFGEIVKPPLEL